MKILIDGDGCNRIQIVENIAKRKKIPVLIFCDWTRDIDSEYSDVHIVEKGMDSVDFALLRYVEPGDIVVTGDSGLASMALAKRAYAIHNNGTRFTENNIGNFLNKRYIAIKSKRDKNFKGLKPRKQKNTLCFGQEFYKLLSYVIKKHNEQQFKNEIKEKEGVLNE